MFKYKSREVKVYWRPTQKQIRNKYVKILKEIENDKN